MVEKIYREGQNQLAEKEEEKKTAKKSSNQKKYELI